MQSKLLFVLTFISTLGQAQNAFVLQDARTTLRPGQPPTRSHSENWFAKKWKPRAQESKVEKEFDEAYELNDGKSYRLYLKNVRLHGKNTPSVLSEISSTPRPYNRDYLTSTQMLNLKTGHLRIAVDCQASLYFGSFMVGGAAAQSSASIACHVFTPALCQKWSDNRSAKLNAQEVASAISLSEIQEALALAQYQIRLIEVANRDAFQGEQLYSPPHPNLVALKESMNPFAAKNARFDKVCPAFGLKETLAEGGQNAKGRH